MGWFIAGFFALRILGVAFIVLLVARLVTGSRERFHHVDRASDILRGRLASGEITEEQYRSLREVLES